MSHDQRPSKMRVVAPAPSRALKPAAEGRTRAARPAAAAPPAPSRSRRAPILFLLGCLGGGILIPVVLRMVG